MITTILVISIIALSLLLLKEIKTIQGKMNEKFNVSEGKTGDLEKFEDLVNKSLVGNLEKLMALSTEKIQPLISQVKEVMKEENLNREAMAKDMNVISLAQQKIHQETQSFTLALKNNIHTLGKFGEEQLENILKYSNFQEDIDYLRAEGNAGSIPDFIIKLPGDKGLVVDSKMSLNDFLSFHEMTDEDKKAEYATALCEKIKKHIVDLSKKKYQEMTTKTKMSLMEFTVMFFASDSIFSLALHHDRDLLRYSTERKVLIATPATIMITLKTIESISRQYKQMENLEEISKSGKTLHSKLADFIKSLVSVQDHLSKANVEINKSVDILTKDITKEARKLETLGIQSGKVIASSKLIEES